ncbi:MAG TPA: methyl-accepting chemotaxis protein [Paenalcaligenes sp.]|nr:methyl-accepting chemotaxis protein [Paenalcaligenes sp.]
MRINLPVMDKETILGPEQYLISKTDLKGRITYANPEFIEVSGYARDELMGKPQNIVRHPDMPPEAFKDFWDTLKEGRPWMGLVKNRRKDGGFYWVHALVAPIFEHDTVTGYASVRVKASSDEIKRADAFYTRIREKKTRGHKLQRGTIVPTGWRWVLHSLKRPFHNSIRGAHTRLTALAVGAIAITAVSVAHPALQELNTLRFIPAALMAVIVALYAGYLSRRIANPIRHASMVAQQISTGNLLLNLEGLRHQGMEEIQRLFFNLDLMRKGLTGISGETRRGVSAAERVVRELRDANQTLSERTQEQARSVQQTAASMEELTTTVQQNADNAMLANQLASSSMEAAKQGGSEVNNLVGTIQDIHQSSKQIADIISIIESIAFQTNILALNAAVESARAGEAGRGFAVVASEVRNLAQRSSQAAGEIKTLIQESVNLVSTGVTQAEVAGKSMRNMVDAAQQVGDVIAEISSASVQQASGLQQINEAISQIDSTTYQNTDFVTHLGQTIARLEHETHELDIAIRVLATESHQQKHASVHSLVSHTEETTRLQLVSNG